MEKHRDVFVRGAVDVGVDQIAASVIQSNLSKDEQQLLFVLLKALSTSVGNGLLSGYFTPFHLLDRSERENAMIKFRDSYISDIR